MSCDSPPPPPESVRTDGRTDGRSYGHVITKFSGLDGLPNFLTHGAPLAPFARWSSAIIPLRILAKYTFSVIIFFSNIEIDLYSFYRENLIVSPKIREKLIGPYTRLRESDELFLSRAKLHRKKPPFCLCVRANYA